MAKFSFEILQTFTKSISVEVDLPRGMDPSSAAAKALVVEATSMAQHDEWETDLQNETVECLGLAWHHGHKKNK